MYRLSLTNYLSSVKREEYFQGLLRLSRRNEYRRQRIWSPFRGKYLWEEYVCTENKNEKAKDLYRLMVVPWLFRTRSSCTQRSPPLHKVIGGPRETIPNLTKHEEKKRTSSVFCRLSTLPFFWPCLWRTRRRRGKKDGTYNRTTGLVFGPITTLRVGYSRRTSRS